MRYAILSDIHGNSLALDAVLRDIESVGDIDGYWLLGDFCAFGPDPAGVLERITQLPNATFIRGNTDRYIVDMEPASNLDTMLNDEARIARYMSLLQALAWAQGVLSATPWLDWLRDLQLDVRMTLPDGTRVLGVHASPGTDDGPGIQPMHTDDDIRKAIDGADADLIFVGHTHWALERRVDDVHVVNQGSVSIPNTPDRRCCYVLLEADENRYTFEHRRVEYDAEAVVAEFERRNLPGRELLVRSLRGQNPPAFAVPK